MRVVEVNSFSTSSLNVSSVGSIGTTGRLLNTLGMVFVIAVDQGLLEGLAARLLTQHVMHRLRVCLLKNIALKIQLYMDVRSKEGVDSMLSFGRWFLP